MASTMEVKLSEVAQRIRELRGILGISVEEAAMKTGFPLEVYENYENGRDDLPFSFIHNCALAFNVDMIDLLEGKSAMLRHYQVMRSGDGQITVDDDGILIRNLAPQFRDKLAEPYFVRYEYDENLQNRPIHTDTHSGQEFDYVLSGKLKVQVGAHTEVLSAGDSILYDSGTPHGMIAVGGGECTFLALVLSGEEEIKKDKSQSIVRARKQDKGLLAEKFVHCVENENGELQ